MTRPRCSMAGCKVESVVGVGINAEPMCQKHYEAWLKACRTSLAAFARLFAADADRREKEVTP